MANYCKNKCSIICSNEEKAFEIYKSIHRDILLEYIKPKEVKRSKALTYEHEYCIVSGDYTDELKSKIKSGEIFIDQDDGSFDEVYSQYNFEEFHDFSTHEKNRFVFGPNGSLLKDYILLQYLKENNIEIMPTSSFYEGKVEGLKAYPRVLGEGFITPRPRFNHDFFQSAEKENVGEDWYMTNWGTFGDIECFKVSLMGNIVDAFFATKWNPPIPALEELLGWNDIASISLTFGSEEIGDYAGTWIDGKLETIEEELPEKQEDSFRFYEDM